jgi:hypothetical protein
MVRWRFVVDTSLLVLAIGRMMSRGRLNTHKTWTKAWPSDGFLAECSIAKTAYQPNGFVAQWVPLFVRSELRRKTLRVGS